MIFRLFNVTFIFHFLMFFSSICYPQINWRINSEIGLFKSSGDGILKKEDLLTRFDGFLEYEYDTDIRNVSVSLRVRPEFYSFKSPVNSIKIKAEGNYFQAEENFNWGLNLTRQINFFNNDVADFTYDIFTLTGNGTWFYFDKLSINTNAGYAYQIIKNDEEYNVDLIFIDCKLLDQTSANTKFGYGFYLERFFITNEILLQGTKTGNENDGWRFGPQVSFNYLKEFIVSVDYKFLMQDSRFTKYFSYEHLIRFIAGKIFFTDWSVFLLVDYNSFFLKKADNYIERVTPLYTSLNLENRISLKIAYELSSNIEVYTKSGYFKDNLYEDKFSLEGWNATIGIELSRGILND